MPLSRNKPDATVDMTQGPILKKLIAYSIPVVISGILQLLFLIGVFGFVNGTMDISFNVVRGMGRSVFPMVSSLI